MKGRGRSGRAKTAPYLLSGLVKCVRCGHTYIGQTVNRGKRREDGTRPKTLYYQCAGYSAKGSAVCTKAPIPKGDIERVVLGAIRNNVQGFLGRGGETLVKKVLKKALKPAKSGTDAERRESRRRIAEIEAEIDRLLDNLSSTTKEFIDRKVGALKEEYNGLKARLTSLEPAQCKAVDVEAIARAIVEQIRQFDDVFAEGTLEEQKEFVGLFVEEIEVDPVKRRAELRIKKFPAPKDLDAGNLSWDW